MATGVTLSLAGYPGNITGYRPKVSLLKKPVPPKPAEVRHSTITIGAAPADSTCWWHRPPWSPFAVLTIYIWHGGTGTLREKCNVCSACAEEWLYDWPHLNFSGTHPSGHYNHGPRYTE